MDASRKANRGNNEVTLQYISPQESLLVEELNEEQLIQLLDNVSRLLQTPAGADELQKRIKHFGECNRTEDENSGQFYHRLRHWLDRDIPQTKSPLHAPRQTGN